MAGTTKALIGIALLLLLGAIAFAWSLTRGPGSDRLEGETGRAVDREEASATVAPEERCAAPATYGRLKRELFRRAAATRGSDQPTFARLSDFAALRVANPVVREEDEGLQRIGCAAEVTLDLPPGVAVVGGRRSLAANVTYSLQPAADGSGDVLTLTSAEAITVPLATLARLPAGGETPQQQEPTGGLDSGGAPLSNRVPEASEGPPEAEPPPPPEPAPSQPTPPEVATPRTTSANPSFDCARASNRAERAICDNSGLASLDRQMATRFFAARREANTTQRVLLDRTRGTFLSYRNRCTSDACIAGAYRGRIREIADIMADRWVAPE